MMGELRRLGGAIANMVARGKVAGSSVGKRTVLQVTQYDRDTKNGVELLLPYGFSANPVAGDVLVLSVGGVRDHQVALGADDTALRIGDLAAGEFGFRDARGQQVVFRSTGIVVTGALAVDVECPNGNVTIHAPNGTVAVNAQAIHVGADGATLHKLVHDAFVALFNGHTHSGVVSGGGTSGVPVQPMTAAHTTSNLTAA